MKRVLVIVGYGLGGLLVAMALSFGAFRLAGRQIGEPATPVQPAFTLAPSPAATGAPSVEPTETGPPKPGTSATSSPSQDDSGSNSGSGGEGADHGGDRHGGDDD